MRSLLSERRSQESAADQAGLKYLTATKQSGRGMLETFERFAQQEYVSASYQDPFVRSHPVADATASRQLRELVAAKPLRQRAGPARAAAAPRHGAGQDLGLPRARRRPSTIAIPPATTACPRATRAPSPATARASATQAMGEVDALIREQAGQSLFLGAQGQLATTGAASIAKPIAPLRKALQLAGGKEPLMQSELAQAHARPPRTRRSCDEAIALLRRAIVTDERLRRLPSPAGEAFYRKKASIPQADLAARAGPLRAKAT